MSDQKITPQQNYELQRRTTVVQLASHILDHQLKERDLTRNTKHEDREILVGIPPEDARALVQACFTVAEAFDSFADAYVQPPKPAERSPLIGL